ncbi:MAG: site-2 protease family protein [Armatimonadota bacterium]|nr:site-2 protease family protein [Armatimonadota bacterium]MDR7454455.1 site-2 protease family protein [Armatimonadota bacterium]MDR7497290.1 site-2 protease family protein [Armatimonadota bacterium]
MLRGGYRLPFRLAGIPLYLDPTFLIVLPLLAWMIGSRIELYVRLFGLPLDPAALQAGGQAYTLGLAAALGLFASVVVHELGHALVGRRYGVQVRRITLWLLGGMAQFEEIPRQRGAEAVIAIAGPLTSLAVAAVSRVALGLLPWSASGQFVLGYLAYMNVALAVFNLLPALPLDGGRVLRSLLALRLPYLRATQVAAGLSTGLAILLGLYGFLTLNIFLMLIAFFVYMAGNAETQTTLITDLLGDIGVREVMTRRVETVPPDLPVADLLQKMLRERHLGYPVVDGTGHLVGVVDLQHVQGAQPDATVERVMSTEVVMIPETGTALEAFQIMSANNFSRLVVVDARKEMVGIVSKTDLVRAIQVRVVGAAFLPAAARG